MQGRPPRPAHVYVNLTPSVPTVPTTLPVVTASPLDLLTPINAPHLPTSDSSRHFDRHSSSLTEHDPDFHNFPCNGGPPSNMSSASSASQPLSAPAYDPNLKCRGCEKQFREGEIQLYKKHSSQCEKLQLLLRHPPEDHTSEEFESGDQNLDPNLTCIGCEKVFGEREIQEFRKHCSTCSLFQEKIRSRTQSSPGERRGSSDQDESHDTTT